MTLTDRIRRRSGVGAAISGLEDRTLRRLIVLTAVALVAGTVLIGALYFLDQYRPSAPSITDKTIQTAEELVRQNQNSASVRFTLAQAYDKAGRYADAVAQYTAILQLKPKTAAVLNARADDQVALGKLDAAVADYQAVVDALKDSEMAAIDPNLEAAYFGLGAVALHRGDAKTAIGNAQNALKIKSTDADALFLLGKAQAMAGDSVSAVASFRKAVSFVPDGWCEPYAAMAKSYTALKDVAGTDYANGMVDVCQNRYDEGRALLQPLTSGSYAVDAYIGLGLAAEKSGDNQAAADAYKQALAKDPQNFLAGMGYGRVTPPAGTVASPSAGATAGSN